MTKCSSYKNGIGKEVRRRWGGYYTELGTFVRWRAGPNAPNSTCTCTVHYLPSILDRHLPLSSHHHLPTMASAEAHARSLYRAILRELPPRTPTIAASPIRSSIRQHFVKPAAATASATTESSSPSSSSPNNDLARRQEIEQFVQYLKAQRKYGELLERYNPGMNMDEEERVRLTARRVGMEMPVDFGKMGAK